MPYLAIMRRTLCGYLQKNLNQRGARINYTHAAIMYDSIFASCTYVMENPKSNSHWLNMQSQAQNWQKLPKTMAMNQQSIQTKSSESKGYNELVVMNPDWSA